MPRKKKTDQPIGVGLTAKQMKRKKPINTDMMRDIEPLTDNQQVLFIPIRKERILLLMVQQELVRHSSLFIMLFKKY